MKKILITLMCISMFMCFMPTVAFAADVVEADTQTVKIIEAEDGAELFNLIKDETSSKIQINVSGTLNYETGDSNGSDNLTKLEGIEELVIAGTTDNAKFIQTGVGVDSAGLKNGKLVLKDIAVEDTTVYIYENGESAWEFCYAPFSGTVEFNNCRIGGEYGGIMTNGNATFIDCEIVSEKKSPDHGGNEYAVWVNNGSASFTNCTFTGKRAIKIHEYYGTEVSSVTVDKCSFGPLSQKPAIAIGTLNADTEVSIRNSIFINCQPGDQSMYIYESDTDVESFTFTNGGEGNENVLCNEVHGEATLNEVPAKEATYTETGNKQYWECPSCHTYFSDSQGTRVIIDKTSVIIPKKIPQSSGSGSGSGSAITVDNVTSSGTADSGTTKADISSSITTSGGTTAATVDKTTADKLVNRAVQNKSAEVVIDGTAKTTSAAQAAIAQVVIPAETLGDIAEKTEADVTIKTHIAEIKMDNSAAAAAAQQAEGNTITIAAEKVKEDEAEIQFSLKVVCSDGTVISDFKGGNVSVKVALPKAMSGKNVVCVYIDEQGYKSKVEGHKNPDGTFTFITGHFSAYAIMTEKEADEAIAAQIEEIKNIKIKISSKSVKSKNGKRGIKISWSVTGDKNLDGVEIFRSEKKNSGYGKKAFYTSEKSVKNGYYINTKALKKGKRYYYKLRGYVIIDGQKVYTDWSNKAFRTLLR